MTPLALIVLLIIVGIALYWIPMDARIKQIIYVVVVVLLLVLLLKLLGVWGEVSSGGI